MCSILLLPPFDAQNDFSVITMEHDAPMCGHCIIGAATTVVVAGMVAVTKPHTRVRFETPAGLVVCDVEVANGKVGSVSFDNVDSFLLHADTTIEVEGFGPVKADIAYGGDFYAVVDADALGPSLTLAEESAIIAAGQRIRAARRRPAHDLASRAAGDQCSATRCFSHPLRRPAEMSSRPSPVPGSLDRSPCGTGTSARVALMHTKGLLGLEESRRFEGVPGRDGRRGRAPRRHPLCQAAHHRTRLCHRLSDDPLPERAIAWARDAARGCAAALKLSFPRRFGVQETTRFADRPCMD
jgi:proline racemase